MAEMFENESSKSREMYVYIFITLIFKAFRYQLTLQTVFVSKFISSMFFQETIFQS